MSKSLPDPAKEPITVPTAAALLKLSIPRTQQLLRREELRGHKEPGRGWVTTRQAVQEYLEARQARRSP